MTEPSDDDELSRVRAEVTAKLERDGAAAALSALAAAIGGELGHPLVPDFFAVAARAGDRRAVEQLVAMGRTTWPSLDPAHARAFGSALAQLGLFELAYDLLGEGPIASDREAAVLRGACALRANRPDDALAAADVAITSLLHEGLSVAEFIRLSLRRAPAEGLLRYDRSAVATIPELHEPLALRWEALRRSGRRDEARDMRSVCIQHFPERASVWSTAGNQALDEGEFEQAERYFDRGLQLDATWAASLAGKAIVLETRKDWPGALQLRARVVEITGALNRDDPGSLHRLMRFAAALARVDRWADAEPLLRRCLSLGVLEKLPPERPVFARVFARELYSPAVIASLFARGGSVDASLEADVKFALREASLLGHLYEQLRTDAAFGESERLGLLGMCAWLAGDAVRAYALLDEAEPEDAPELALHYLLASSAAAAGASDRPSVERFALRAAESVLERVARGEELAEEERLYAKLIAARSGGPGVLEGLIVPAWRGPVEEPASARIRRLVAFRAAARATGRSALEVARESVDGLEAIVTARRERAEP